MSKTEKNLLLSGLSFIFGAAWLKKFRQKGPVVPVVRLSGVITASQGGFNKSGLSLGALAGLIEAAFEVKNAKSVAFIINSPGGSPVQSSLIGKRIRDLAEEKKLPVFAFVEDVAASGGYWLACATDEIYADHSSIVGSIGVISAGFGFDKLIEHYGIERRIYTSGKSKSTLDPFKPEKKEDIAKLKKIQNEIHDHFINWVKTRRGAKLKGDDETLFNGDFWTGDLALNLGLIDEIGDIRTVLRRKYGKKVKLIQIRDDKPWWKMKPDLGIKLPQNIGSELMASLEERSVWSRFGL